MFWLYYDGEWVVQWNNTNAYSIPHTCAKGNAKATAYAVSTAYVAVVKGLKESESNRELASSLLLGGGALRIMRHAFWSAAVLRRF